jgi:uncharacterized protein Yka (UPF0111/DUF47 family)
MFSLQRLLGKEDKFFDLLEASAEEARSSVQALKRILNNPAPTLDEFIASRRKDKQITAEISEQIARTFVTALEREDIQALSNALYKIPKTIEKFAERYLISSAILASVDFSRQVTMLEQATDLVVAMVKSLRHLSNLEEIQDQNARLQHVEGEADKVMLDLLRDLYSGRHEALKVFILKDLYELLEKVIDRCRDAGNVAAHIVLKNS